MVHRLVRSVGDISALRMLRAVASRHVEDRNAKSENAIQPGRDFHGYLGAWPISGVTGNLGPEP